jgi:Tfp pilus assembly protein PilV
MVVTMDCGLRKVASDKGGYTLAEVMVASIILMLVSIAFIGGLITALRAQYTASDYYRASSIARNTVQHIKQNDFGTISSLNKVMWPIDENTGDDLPLSTAPSRFHRSIVVSNINSKCVDITVDVYFPIFNQTQSAKPVTIKTMIFEGM